MNHSGGCLEDQDADGNVYNGGWACEASGRALSGIQLEIICVTLSHRIGQDPISVLKV